MNYQIRDITVLSAPELSYKHIGFIVQIVLDDNSTLSCNDETPSVEDSLKSYWQDAIKDFFKISSYLAFAELQGKVDDNNFKDFSHLTFRNLARAITLKTYKTFFGEGLDLDTLIKVNYEVAAILERYGIYTVSDKENREITIPRNINEILQSIEENTAKEKRIRERMMQYDNDAERRKNFIKEDNALLS